MSEVTEIRLVSGVFGAVLLAMLLAIIIVSPPVALTSAPVECRVLIIAEVQDGGAP